MKKNEGWLQRQRRGLWHLRTGGVEKYKEWKLRQSNSAKSTTPKTNTPHKSALVPTTIEDVDLPVIASIASIPTRVSTLEVAFHSIYWQVDRVHVYLNNFDEVPHFLLRPRVEIHRSQDHGDLKDVGKFFALQQISDGILFTIDDDIAYPPDYVSRLLTLLASTDYKAVVGVHGFWLPRFPKSFFDRHTFHFPKAVEAVAPVSVLGTGTSAFDIRNVDISLKDFPSYGMADIHFAAHLKREGIPALVVPRTANWLTGLEPTDEVTLFDRTLKDNTQHSKILRDHSPWGEGDLLRRWQPLINTNAIDSDLRTSIEMLSRSNSDGLGQFTAENSSKIDENFSSIKNWLDIYGDPISKENLFEQVLESRCSLQTKRQALHGLRATNIRKAVEASRALAFTHRDDVAIQRGHAQLCGDLYQIEEAQEHYLRAVRGGGARNNPDTARILYEYFSFLVKAAFYENAKIVAASLKPSHESDPTFQALLTFIALQEGDSNTARLSFAKLFHAKQRPRNQALQLLVRLLSERQITWSKYSIITREAITDCANSPTELLTLLKIATEIRDADGSRWIWETLTDNFPEYINNNPDVVLYFRSNWESHHTYPEQGLLGPSKLIQGEQNIRIQPSSASVTISSRNRPLISVLLTAYNSEATLTEAIRSILDQSYSDLELIIVDDASDDNTARIATSWVERDSRVSLIENEVNRGPYTSRNVAIKAARGQFIAIQDADDISLPERLALQLDVFTPHVKAVLGRHLRVGIDGAVRLENDGSILGHGPVTLMARMEVFKEIGLFADVRTRGDKEFESRIENYYGTNALMRLPDVIVYALHDGKSNSHREIATPEKKRELLLFKEEYNRRHSMHDFKRFYSTAAHQNVHTR